MKMWSNGITAIAVIFSMVSNESRRKTVELNCLKYLDPGTFSGEK